jgi:DNA-binding MarR family transcriptional regulator
MSEPAHHVLMISGGLTRLADRLEHDGLITHSRDAEDFRGYEARIIPVGRKALRHANRQHVEDVRELFLDHVTQEDLKGSRRDMAPRQSRQRRALPDRVAHLRAASSRPPTDHCPARESSEGSAYGIS